MLLFSTILFGDKFGAAVHWKFLPLLRDFVSIGQYSWGSTCLTHLYRALCKASCFDCKKIDGALTLLLAGVSHQERSLDKAHGEVLTGLKNLDGTTATTHSFWVMQRTNRYNHVPTELPMSPQHPLEIYVYWYRSKYDNYLNLLDLVVQENDEGNPVRDDDNQEQEP
ncbi:hypothetical protein Ahy_B04g073483 [Arachis hypogaea]|uniref:Aminotransferase-like plant mobile domain-containing protein n=1 Tax=Arachis hypogaea TaxID=3818 RepID=A0A444ZQJ0_ARAHY|nr:hypothetical protein Ahy_B04g073483 [Arachis hypogaea]